MLLVAVPWAIADDLLSVDCAALLSAAEAARTEQNVALVELNQAALLYRKTVLDSMAAERKVTACMEETRSVLWQMLPLSRCSAEKETARLQEHRMEVLSSYMNQIRSGFYSRGMSPAFAGCSKR
jgi:hypothetical protein